MLPNTDEFAAANDDVKVLLRPWVIEQSNELAFQDSTESDTSSESDIAEITDIREMRDIISRMDDEDDGGDHDKCDSLAHHLPYIAHCFKAYVD